MSDDKKSSSSPSTTSTSGANQTLLEISEKNFDEIVAWDKPVLVDFWATWCGPCQFMLPIFDKLAKKYGDRVSFGRINVDDNQGVAMRFDVYAIPTFIVFMNGKAIDRAVGAVGEKGLEGLLQKYQ
ncbi:MAG TPA: thioredoxin [Nitrososphaeraceae archaeon]|nr:thioredoxin [Nitrososphaeraceae archaeon]